MFDKLLTKVGVMFLALLFAIALSSFFCESEPVQKPEFSVEVNQDSTSIRFLQDGEYLSEWIHVKGEKGDPGISIKGDQGDKGDKGDPGEPGETGYMTVFQSDTIYTFPVFPCSLYMDYIKDNLYVLQDKYKPSEPDISEDAWIDSVGIDDVEECYIYYISRDSCAINFQHDGKDINGNFEDAVRFQVGYEDENNVGHSLGFTEYYYVTPKSDFMIEVYYVMKGVPVGKIVPSVCAIDASKNKSTWIQSDKLGWYYYRTE